MTAEFAEAVDALASLIRAGASPRAAVTLWPEHAPSSLKRVLERVARRVTLGAAPEHAIRAARELDEVSDAIAAAFVVHRSSGASLAEMLERVSAATRRRVEANRSAGAGSAGARMSARLVAGLPLAFVPLMPAARSSMFDVTGSAILILGVALCAGGLRWVSSLIPAPPRDDEVAQVAECLAGVLRAGGTLAVAMSVALAVAPEEIRNELERAARRVRLGVGWTRALSLSEGPVNALAPAIARSYRRGLPAADVLEELARGRRAAAASDFEVALRRAPVMMVLPLTLCVLPAYALLGLAPFVRGIAPL
ncbi:MAG: hypothetical protein QOH26_623 [Actinomycetota bacterium]|nr:hypothetical protein [Actinomycetota bacterium]